MEAAKKKPGLAILLGLGGKSKDEEDDKPDMADDDGDDEQAEHDAMEEFVSAIEAKDTGKALEAFKVLRSLCGGEE